MRVEAFGAGKFGGDRREPRESTVGNFLHADALHEIGDGKAAARARDASGGKHVIGAAGVVAESLRAPVAEENASGGIDAIEQGAG